MEDLLKKAKAQIDDAYNHLLDEFKTMRSGRATTALVENIEVMVYEQAMPLKSLASIATPDAKSISIAPWDASNIEAIEKAIRDRQELGLNPQNDGKNIHINVPPMTEERREQQIKQLSEKIEQANIRIRGARHDALNIAKRQQKEGGSEDDLHRLEKDLNAAIDEYKQKIDEAAALKRNELREI
jgi:ribosome recycling factor